MKLKFSAFKAIDNSKYCELFIEGHVSVLKDYGITNITTNNNSWIFNPNVYCVVALLENEIVGGIRIQISDEHTLLPVEEAISKMDKGIHDIVLKYRNSGGVGELCALWNAKKIAGIGISTLLTRAGISIINQLNFKTLMGICANYTLNMFRNVGFKEDKSIGNNGEFNYPNSDYIAWVLGIMNAETLDSASEYDKERMDSLRSNPNQIKIEEGSKQKIEIQYELLIS